MASVGHNEITLFFVAFVFLFTKMFFYINVDDDTWYIFNTFSLLAHLTSQIGFFIVVTLLFLSQSVYAYKYLEDSLVAAVWGGG